MPSSFTGLPTAGVRLFRQAKRLVKQRHHAKVYQAVEDTFAVPTTGKNAQISQALKLIRDSLRLHPHRIGQVGNADFFRPNDGVKKTKPGVVRQDLEHGSQPACLNRRQQWTLLQGRLWWTGSVGLGLVHWVLLLISSVHYLM
jgi:hypothetical protein